MNEAGPGRGGSAHRAWIQIDHDALRGNLAAVRRLAGRQSLIGVVKANAYGHGAVEVSRTLVAEGVERLAVATLGEALELRAAGIGVPIVVFFRVTAAEVDTASAGALAGRASAAANAPHAALSGPVERYSSSES